MAVISHVEEIEEEDHGNPCVTGIIVALDWLTGGRIDSNATVRSMSNRVPVDTTADLD
jgi:hypothetical protein